MEKLVSIVVPVYNAERYITNCINALQGQLYSNIEIILVDDGSIDRSLEICKMFADKDHRIKVVQKENGGVSSARNEGVKLASGEYLMFADSDDMADRYWIKRMVELAERWRVNFVISSYHVAHDYSDVKLYDKHMKEFEPVWALTKEEFYNVLGYMIVYQDTMFCPWNKLFVTEIIKSHDLKFPEDMSYGEDFLFNLQYLEYCNGVIETREQLYNYILQNPDSLEAQYKPDLYENQMKLYYAAKEFMIAHQVYYGYNMSNLAYYCANRVVASIKNQFHRENVKTENERREYIGELLKNKDVIASVLLADLYDNSEQTVITNLVKEKNYDYDLIYNVFEQKEFSEKREATVRFKLVPKHFNGWKWIVNSLKYYGILVMVKRTCLKVTRMLRRR